MNISNFHKFHILHFILAFCLVLAMMVWSLPVFAQDTLMDLECATASTTGCVYFHHITSDSDYLLATQNPFYFVLIFVLLLLPSALFVLVLFYILKFLTFLWAWRKL